MQKDVAYSTRGGVTLHGKFIAEGKATIRLVDQRVSILLSKGNPDELRQFLHLFSSKVGHFGYPGDHLPDIVPTSSPTRMPAYRLPC